MAPRDIIILGSTGSIGCSAADVLRAHPGRFRVRALAARSNIDLLEQQYREFRPDTLAVIEPMAGEKLAARLADEQVRVVVGEEELTSLVRLEGVDLILNAIVGSAGLLASLETVKLGKTLALANKESLVAGGPLFAPLLKETGATILPIDSEHSAIWQAMMAGKPSEVRRILLTGSGGPFRDYPIDRFADITVEQALKHPNWEMGRKITIDSATMANKGLEIIEAVTLFSVPVDKVKVVIHPQSIVHSMVEFNDSSVVAQLSHPDMRLPITCALFWPDRVESDFGRMDFEQALSLSFEEPDFERFPALKLGFDVAAAGGTAPAVYNAANEVAVEAFLNKTIRFIDIPETIQATLNKAEIVDRPTLEDILAADNWSRRTAGKLTETMACC